MLQTSEGLYPAGIRVDEIASWLESNGHPDWIAIDDAPMGTEQAQVQRPRHVHTRPHAVGKALAFCSALVRERALPFAVGGVGVV